MEDAGASIVSPAAELVTRETDPADEERELPSAIHDLIRRLEGKGELITSLPLLDGPEFQDFFPERESLSKITGWRSKVRLRVLEAISNCNTLEAMDVRDICGGYISRLTPSEWELVLRKFRSSTVLQQIRLDSLEWSSDEDVESLCLQVGRILKTSSVTDLTVYNCRLSARCFLNLASGLRGNLESNLKYLTLVNAWEESSAVKHVADMINSAPLLVTLDLRVALEEDMDEETVGILSQALIHSSSLKCLWCWGRGMKWGAALLMKALAGDDGNRSIEQLRLWRMDGLGDCLREILISNPSLMEMRLNSLRMCPEEWHQLGEVIRDNARETSILVWFDLDHDDDWKSIEALECAARSDVKDPTVQLGLVPANEHELMLSLNLLGRVLLGEIRSINFFCISASEVRISGSNQDRMESILPMNGKTGETSVVKSLGIESSKGIWKQLFWCLRGNTSLTLLNLSGSQLDEEDFRDLMSLLQVNLTLQEIDVKGTSWETEGKAAMIQESLKQNKKRAAYLSVFREAKLTSGHAKAGRLFIFGSPRAGKTQLRRTMMRIIQGKSWLGNKWDSLRRTKGIEVEFVQISDEMQISIWDLAGQSIFRTLQNVLFPQTNNFCVFLFVYSPFCKPDSCFKIELEDWLSFITSSTRVMGHNLPQVLVVISHKDKAIYRSLTWAHSIVDELMKKFEKFVLLHPIQECFHVDARKKKRVIPLKNHIFEIFEKLLREKSPRVPQLCSQLSSLLVTNTKENRNCPLWSTKKFYDFCAPSLTPFIPSFFAHFVDYSSIIDSIVSYLNVIGSIVHISNLEYIIVDPNWLTNTFLGELIALGQDFQAQESESWDKRISRVSYTSKDGFVSESVSAGLMEEFLGKQPYLQRGVDRCNHL